MVLLICHSRARVSILISRLQLYPEVALGLAAGKLRNDACQQIYWCGWWWIGYHSSKSHYPFSLPRNSPLPIICCTSTRSTGTRLRRNVHDVRMLMPQIILQPSPTRVSPRKASSSTSSYQPHPSISTSTGALPTPLSMSPTTNSTHSFTPHRLPPSFDPHHTSSRYPASQHTPFSPYRPGEYGRSERGLASERTKIERKLFEAEEEDEGDGNEDKDREELMVPSKGGREEGSSPLAPAFEAKMVLRNGASVDLKW